MYYLIVFVLMKCVDLRPRANFCKLLRALCALHQDGRVWLPGGGGGRHRVSQGAGRDPGAGQRQGVGGPTQRWKLELGC